MLARELIADEVTGAPSHSRLWSNIANAAMTVAFLKIVWTSAASEGLAMIFLAYGGIVAGSQMASKFLSYRYRFNGNGGSKPGKAPKRPRGVPETR